MTRFTMKHLLRNFLNTLSIIILLYLSNAEAQSNLQTENKFGCHCMEYWTCITGGGDPYSYCGLSASSVCCFVPLNAKPVGILPTFRARKVCGRKGADTAKDGFAEMSEWPWHAALLEGADDLYLCGASLLAESWVLTAAHCVDEYMPYNSTIGQLKVRLGEYDVSTTSEPLQHIERRVKKIILHPQFDNNTLSSDIALLELESPAERSANIQFVCIPTLNTFTPEKKHKCFITGWGRKNEASQHSVVLKEISVPLWKNSKCQTALRGHFGSSYRLPSTALCAGSEGNDACDGDGGGPLVCEKNGHWYQVGIVSFGIGCGRRNLPGVYTKVDSFLNWIEENTNLVAPIRS